MCSMHLLNSFSGHCMNESTGTEAYSVSVSVIDVIDEVLKRQLYITVSTIPALHG